MASKYFVDARIRIPLLNVFIVLSIGKNQRSGGTPTVENEKRRNSVGSLLLLGSTILMWTFLSAVIIFGAALYTIKMYVGIDLIQGNSPLPEFLKAIGFCYTFCH